MAAESIAASRRLASAPDVQLGVPECALGIGAVILKADSPELIEGVRIQPVSIYADDRGYFLEVQRMGQGLAAAFPAASTQVAAALNFAGAIKAFTFTFIKPIAGRRRKACCR